MYLLRRCLGVALALAGVLSAGCKQPSAQAPTPSTRPAENALRSYEYRQIHMGVQARLVVYSRDEESAANACRLAYRRIAQIDRIASDYILDSELNRLCARAGGEPASVSPELFFLLQTACELAHNSDGAFDPTAAPLIRLWRQARKAGQLPPPDQLDAARKLVGWRKIKLDPERRTVQLTVPGMKLDLGGIAKGYAAHQAVLTLKQQGMPMAFCEFGGDVYVGEAPPGHEGWAMEVTNDLPGGKSRTILVKNTGVSTSGDLEQFVVIDGKRYSHIVDPRTGLGLTNSVLVTVLHPQGILSDGLSTALSVLPPEQGRALANAYGARAHIRSSQ